METERIERSLSLKIGGVFFVGVVIGLFFLFTRSYGIGFPTSESVGNNIFWLDKKNHSYTRGQLVTFTYRGEPFKEYRAGSTFLKYAQCVAGDTLTVSGRSYFCNGEFMGNAVLMSSDGEPMKNFVYNGEIPQGYFFALGSHPKSYDSRYWGFVKDEDVKATASKMF